MPSPQGSEHGSAVSVEIGEDHVACVRLERPPNNLLTMELVSGIADAFESLDDDPRCRAIVLAASGKHFCAGMDITARENDPPRRDALDNNPLYVEATRILACGTPSVAAVQGAVIGGGFGLALVTDFRVASPESRFAASFSRLGLHHGFGVTATLPPLVGEQRTLEILMTGRQFDGRQAHAWGLVDRLAPAEGLVDAARDLAREIADCGPLAVRSIRATMRTDAADRFRRATEIEYVEQQRLTATEDVREGIRAARERRPPHFVGR